MAVRRQYERTKGVVECVGCFLGWVVQAARAVEDLARWAATPGTVAGASRIVEVWQ